ncbi:MAG: IPT/TIG domain-containing protein [Anaerolineae bacterium]|nr:IPT/TIG domain-containing protein [Anaerolineae bacterium]MDW8171958.1 IPT/TIG domain-containing protein [Anaerolineae bacterium]
MKHLAYCLLGMILLVSWASAQETTPALEEPIAQVATDTETPTPSPTPSSTPTPVILSVTSSEPRSLPAEQAATLSVYGTNFSADSRVRLVGYGILATTFLNDRTLTAQLPSNVSVGIYTLQVIDPVRGTSTSPQTLTIVPTALVLPTSTPIPMPTFVPGKPALIARSFSAFPSTIRPGQATQLLIEIVNQGNATAFGISLTLDGGKFLPADGQAAALLDSLPAGGFARLLYNVEAMRDAVEGPNSIPVAISYRSAEGETFTSKATFSVDVSASPQVASVVLARHLSEPNAPQAGQRVVLTMLFQNNGSSAASQVQVRLPAGGGSPLLPAEEGDTFNLGDLASGASVQRRFPMIVANDVKSGPQSQPVTITYLQGAERKEVQTALSVRIATPEAKTPLLLLESYRADGESLAPGQTFSLEVTLNNIGNADASEVLATFGTVNINPPSSGDGGGSGGGSGNETSTTPNSTFAPLGSSETSYLGTLPQGQKVTIRKDFIVNGAVKSGLYALPLSVRYRDGDGKAAQVNFQLTLLVVVPLRALFTLDSPAPREMFVSDMLEMAWTVQNLGNADARFDRAEVSAEGLEVVSGASSFVGTVKPERKTNFSASLIAAQTGEARVIVKLHYLDEMNRRQALTETYSVLVVERPIIDIPDPGEEPPPFEPPTPTPEPQRSWLERLLLGLFGLGSQP